MAVCCCSWTNPPLYPFICISIGQAWEIFRFGWCYFPRFLIFTTITALLLYHIAWEKRRLNQTKDWVKNVLRNLSSTLALVMAMLGLLFIGLAWLKVARVGSESDLPWWISLKINKSCNESWILDMIRCIISPPQTICGSYIFPEKWFIFRENTHKFPISCCVWLWWHNPSEESRLSQEPNGFHGQPGSDLRTKTPEGLSPICLRK